MTAADPNYSFSLVATAPGQGYTSYVLDMTSQAWRSSPEVNRTLWQHWLSIVVPDAVERTSAFLWISGGSNGGSPPASATSFIVELARQTRTVAAVQRASYPSGRRS